LADQGYENNPIVWEILERISDPPHSRGIPLYIRAMMRLPSVEAARKGFEEYPIMFECQ